MFENWIVMDKINLYFTISAHFKLTAECAQILAEDQILVPSSSF